MSRKDALTHEWYYLKEQNDSLGCARCGLLCRVAAVNNYGPCSYLLWGNRIDYAHQYVIEGQPEREPSWRTIGMVLDTVLQAQADKLARQQEQLDQLLTRTERLLSENKEVD